VVGGSFFLILLNPPLGVGHALLAVAKFGLGQ
jgi:hypothetical protein